MCRGADSSGSLCPVTAAQYRKLYTGQMKTIIYKIKYWYARTNNHISANCRRFVAGGDRYRIERELERVRIEKATIEKVLLSNLSRDAEISEQNNDKPIK